MGIGLIVIDKSFQGETWSNTYAFAAGTPPVSTAGLTTDDLVAIGSTQPMTPQNTDARPQNSANYVGGEFLLHALVGFERLLYCNEITIDRVYVTDGRENPQSGGALYAAIPTQLVGLSTDTADNILPGSVTLLINRVPAGLGQRPGRIYLRGVLAEGVVSFGGNKLVRFSSAAARQATNGTILTSVANAELGNYFNNGSSNTVRLGIAKYASPLTTSEPVTNDLVAVALINSFAVVGPVARQVNKGRRKPSNPTP